MAHELVSEIIRWPLMDQMQHKACEKYRKNREERTHREGEGEREKKGQNISHIIFREWPVVQNG